MKQQRRETRRQAEDSASIHDELRRKVKQRDHGGARLKSRSAMDPNGRDSLRVVPLVAQPFQVRSNALINGAELGRWILIGQGPTPQDQEPLESCKMLLDKAQRGQRDHRLS